MPHTSRNSLTFSRPASEVAACKAFRLSSYHFTRIGALRWKNSLSTSSCLALSFLLPNRPASSTNTSQLALLPPQYPISAITHTNYIAKEAIILLTIPYSKVIDGIHWSERCVSFITRGPLATRKPIASRPFLPSQKPKTILSTVHVKKINVENQTTRKIAKNAFVSFNLRLVTSK